MSFWELVSELEAIDEINQSLILEEFYSSKSLISLQTINRFIIEKKLSFNPSETLQIIDFILDAFLAEKDKEAEEKQKEKEEKQKASLELLLHLIPSIVQLNSEFVKWFPSIVQLYLNQESSKSCLNVLKASIIAPLKVSLLHPHQSVECESMVDSRILKHNALSSPFLAILADVIERLTSDSNSKSASAVTDAWSLIMVLYGTKLHRTKHLNALLEIAQTIFNSKTKSQELSMLRNWLFLIWNFSCPSLDGKVNRKNSASWTSSTPSSLKEKQREMYLSTPSKIQLLLIPLSSAITATKDSAILSAVFLDIKAIIFQLSQGTTALNMEKAKINELVVDNVLAPVFQLIQGVKNSDSDSKVPPSLAFDFQDFLLFVSRLVVSSPASSEMQRKEESFTLTKSLLELWPLSSAQDASFDLLSKSLTDSTSCVCTPDLWRHSDFQTFLSFFDSCLATLDSKRMLDAVHAKGSKPASLSHLSVLFRSLIIYINELWAKTSPVSLVNPVPSAANEVKKTQDLALSSIRELGAAMKVASTRPYGYWTFFLDFLSDNITIPSFVKPGSCDPVVVGLHRLIGQLKNVVSTGTLLGTKITKLEQQLGLMAHKQGISNRVVAQALQPPTITASKSANTSTPHANKEKSPMPKVSEKSEYVKIPLLSSVRSPIQNPLLQTEHQIDFTESRIEKTAFYQKLTGSDSFAVGPKRKSVMEGGLAISSQIDSKSPASSTVFKKSRLCESEIEHHPPKFKRLMSELIEELDQLDHFKVDELLAVQKDLSLMLGTICDLVQSKSLKFSK